MTGTACDTSVLVPGLSSWHPVHDRCRAALAEVTDVPLHVLIESYSVLTRLPSPHRVIASAAAEVLNELSLEVASLSGAQSRDLVTTWARHEVAGGAAYDALVGVTAREHGLHLLTRDRRARTTYEALGVAYTLV